MAVKYQNVWRTMNDLQTVTCKISSAREILDCAIDAHQEHKYEKVEHLLYAVDEFLQYYLKEFDNKFKDAWKATVGDLRDGDVEHSAMEYVIDNHKKSLTCDKDDPSPECKGAWNDFWEEHYYPEEAKEKETKNWVIPVEADPSGEYFLTFPDDLLEAANLKEGDTVEWVDNKDGSYTFRKVEKTKLIGMEEC